MARHGREENRRKERAAQRDQGPPVVVDYDFIAPPGGDASFRDRSSVGRHLNPPFEFTIPEWKNEPSRDEWM
jgi:hypothetical protein